MSIAKQTSSRKRWPSKGDYLDQQAS